MTPSQQARFSSAADGRKAWQRATSAEKLLQSPNFYVHVPSRTDPTAAPAGGDSIMVLLPVANMQEAGTGEAHQHSIEVSVICKGVVVLGSCCIIQTASLPAGCCQPQLELDSMVLVVR